MKKFSFVLFVFLSICLCISCGQLISTAILTTFGQSTTISTQNQIVYALSTRKSPLKSDIENQVSLLQSQNGAGFVFEQNEYFFLIASIYENVNDAELVKNNLKTNGVSSEILTISLKKQTIEGNFSADEKMLLNEALNANFETFKSLYDTAISLDTGVFDKAKAKLSCSEIYSKLIATKTKLESVFDKNKQIDDLKKELDEACEILSELICENFESQNQTYSSLIKLSYCKILPIAY